MTTPTPHGYPDWGRFMAQADTRVFNYENETLSALFSTPARFVGALPWVIVEMSTPATRARANLFWYADEAMTQLVDSYPLTCKSTAQLQVALPVGASFLQADLELTAYPDDITFTVDMIPAPVSDWTETLGNKILTANGTNLPAAATTTISAIRVTSGWANIWVEAFGATNVEARLLAVNFGGTRNSLVRWQISGAKDPRNLYIPPLPLELDLVNADAVDRTLNGYILRGTPGLP